MSIRMSIEELLDIAERIKMDAGELQHVVSHLDYNIGLVRDSGIEPGAISFLKEYDSFSESVRMRLPNIVNLLYGVVQELEKQRAMVSVYDSPRESSIGFKSDREYPKNFLE